MRDSRKIDPFSVPCLDCDRDVGSVEGPFYPVKEGILCADCGEKREAEFFNNIIVKRDGAPS